MKYKTTAKAIREGACKPRSAGYCEIQWLLYNHEADAYTSGVYGWNFDVYEACCVAVHVTKEPFHWGDTYVIDFSNPADELPALLLVLAIDAANCSNGV